MTSPLEKIRKKLQKHMQLKRSVNLEIKWIKKPFADLLSFCSFSFLSSASENPAHPDIFYTYLLPMPSDFINNHSSVLCNVVKHWLPRSKLTSTLPFGRSFESSWYGIRVGLQSQKVQKKSRSICLGYKIFI